MFFKVTQKAFSLVELMVVIAIIAIIASISLASITAIQKTSRDAQRQADLRSLQGVLQQYYADKGRYPNAMPNLTDEAAFTNCSGTTSVAGNLCTVTKTYLSKTPKGPNGEAYFYRPYVDVDTNSCGITSGTEVGTCHKYYICATLEGLPSPSGTLCVTTGTYNLRLTQP